MGVRGALLGVLLAGSLGQACTLTMRWGGHTSLRSATSDLSLAHVEPSEAVTGVVSANLHYVTVALDTVFMRNLPGLAGKTVAVGAEVSGVLPGGKPLHTVLEVQTAKGDHSFLTLDNAALVEPFLYTGQNLSVGLHFKALHPEAVEHIQGRLAGAAQLVKKLDPQKGEAVEAGAKLFHSIVGETTAAKGAWTYQFTLYPADSVYRDKPELLLTAARHVLLLLPPADAPAEWRALTSAKLAEHLRLRGNRLVWRSDETEYTETPYLILNITRYRRYPKEDTDLRKVARELDTFLENGNLDVARALLPQLAGAILKDTVLTAAEKNLERSWKDAREARIDMELARRSLDAAGELRHLVRHLGVLAQLLRDFPRLLYPYERKNLLYQARQLARRAEVLAGEHRVDASAALQATAALEAEVRRQEEATRAGAPVAPKAVATAPRTPPPPRPRWRKPHERWWFWPLVSAGAAALGAGSYFLSRAQTATVGPYPSVVVPVAPAALRVGR